MSTQYAVALVGDYDPSVPAHQAIPIALDLAAAHHRVCVKPDWIATKQIKYAEVEFASYHGIWCVPASPYENTPGALDAIRFARERRIPFLGACGGFQHALIEYARNVPHLPNTEHAETNPEAVRPLISALTCSLAETRAELILEPSTILYRSCGTTRICEEYQCSYGPNPEHENSSFPRVNAAVH